MPQLPREALADAYDAYAPRLFAMARRLVGAADAEECVQEVFVKLVERSAGLPRIEDLRAYLFASLRHAALLRMRRERRQDALRDAALIEVAYAEAQPQLRAALQKLPPEQREVLALKIDGELTFAEIGALLGMSLSTAASRYRYALTKLREALKP